MLKEEPGSISASSAWRRHACSSACAAAWTFRRAVDLVKQFNDSGVGRTSDYQAGGSLKQLLGDQPGGSGGGTCSGDDIRIEASGR